MTTRHAARQRLDGRRFVTRAGASLLLGAALVGCTSAGALPEVVHPSRRGGVTFIGPRCPDVRSCLVGQVVTAETATPLPRAAVFLEKQDAADAPVRILTLTDDQGVFTVTDAPMGLYRLAIYKDARKIEARGLKLGAPGTTLMPIRMSPSSG